jgi:hypothetical protein
MKNADGIGYWIAVVWMPVVWYSHSGWWLVAAAGRGRRSEGKEASTSPETTTARLWATNYVACKIQT